VYGSEILYGNIPEKYAPFDVVICYSSRAATRNMDLISDLTN
jgi:hypothetical protein